MNDEKNIKNTIIDIISAELDKQNKKGFAKYKRTLDECDEESYDWSQMIIEELIDCCQYQQKEIKRLKKIIKNSGACYE